MNNIKKNSISTYTVEESIELLPFLLELFDNKSRNSVKSILKRGQVKINGQVITQHNHQLNPGQKVVILNNRASIKQSALTGIKILHEDEAIIVINKDAGLLSVAANNPDELNAYQQLNDYVKKDNPKNSVFTVHRLDRDTSGVMIFAKTEKIKNKLQSNWNRMVKERTYTALVEGKVKDKKGTISSWLSQNEAMKVYSSSHDNGGKHAVTNYKKITGNADFSLLEVELKTGRKNQIRVHLQDIGHPIVGDKKYGSKINPIKRLGLHATTLAFIHPVTNKLVRYTVKPPKMFNKLVK